MPRIPRKALHRPLQGGARILGGGGIRRPRTLADSFQQAHNSANRANERRYGQIMQGYDALRDRTASNLQGLGAQESMDIDRSYHNLGSDAYNRLVNRGFANSSLLATMGMGINRERLASRGRLNDRLAQQRIGADMAITQGKLGAIERRNDIGPDPAMLAQLAQMQGSGGGVPSGFGSFVLPPSVNQGQVSQAYQNALAQHMGLATAQLVPNFRNRPLVGRGGGYGSAARKRRYLG